LIKVNEVFFQTVKILLLIYFKMEVVQKAPLS